MANFAKLSKLKVALFKKGTEKEANPNRVESNNNMMTVLLKELADQLSSTRFFYPVFPNSAHRNCFVLLRSNKHQSCH